jgi:hypothetical protein
VTIRQLVLTLFALVSLAAVPAPAAAQDPDPLRELRLAEPDFTLGALPTSLQMPVRTWAFRLTHRFARPIAEGSVGDFFADFFGMDGAARIGLEVRFGLWSGGQIVAHRTNDRAIQLLLQQRLIGQDRFLFSVDALVASEGQDNFSEDFSGTVGAVVSRTFGDHVALYAQPYFVVNSNPDPFAASSADRTMIVGAGVRIRLGGSKVYVVAEAAPQVWGFRDGADHLSFGIERRAGGHIFQLTIANALGTTLRQIARGGANPGDWYIGFNLSRRFF